ncbi:MAG TPA: cellulase family glycosylhydrolase, partial [Candidatus Saccharimonas sp.]|nr:cellulase family glycosylhydrolase [Candidatus Saccharimonas sp.]
MPKKSAHKSRRHTPSPFFMIATAIIGTLLVGAAALRVGLGPAAPGLHLPGGQARTLPGLSTYGISGSFGDLSAADLTKRLADIHATGASWIRYDLNWGHVQLAGPSSFDWSVPDRVTTAAHDQGLEVVMTIDLTPPWQRVPGCNQGERCAPQDPDAYAAFAAAAVTHYLSYGVHVWEIWNEPNIAYRFGPATDPIKYTKMLTRASARIRQADPTATIIAASTAPASSKHGDL